MARPVYLVDASIYIFQAYFSSWQVVEAADGRDISAFHGYARFLLRFLGQTRPQHVMAAFDESLFCGFRHTLYAGYKANRELPDDNLARQLAACARLTQLLGVAAFGSRNYEADDIIGTVAARARREANHEVCMVSRDKDLAQLLHSEGDHLWDFSGNRRRYSRDIQQQYGIRPDQFADYLGLVGDAIDSIPGVPGLGPVAASCLLRHFESIPVLYENLHEVPNLSYRGAKRGPDLLRQHEEMARLSRTLATIVQDADHPDEPFSAVGCSDLAWRDFDAAAIEDLLATEGVDTLARERFMELVRGLDAARSRDDCLQTTEESEA